jgi:glycosyltransferase involved in cell wall biosynthesis
VSLFPAGSAATLQRKRRIAMFQPGLSPASLGRRGHEDLAAALRALGHEFRLLSACVEASSDDASPRVLPTPAWTRGVVAELGAPLLRTRIILPSALALARYLRREGAAIDVLYTLVAYPHATATALAIVWSGWKGCFVVMPGGEDLLVAEGASFGFRRFLVPRRLVGWTLRRADGICCQSLAFREILLRYRPAGVIHRVPENVAADVVTLADESPAERRLRRERARRQIDRELGTEGVPLVLALGRLHPVKGFDRLIDILPSLPHRLVMAGPSLEIRGHGDVATVLRARAREHGVADRVIFTGRVPREKSYELLAAADVLAIPSHCEGIPKVAVEAAALGTPFVLTATCGVAADLDGEDLGRIVAHWDAAAFAAELASAVGARPDPERARAFVHRFSPERVASDLDRLLGELPEPVRKARTRPNPDPNNSLIRTVK